MVDWRGRSGRFRFHYRAGYGGHTAFGGSLGDYHTARNGLIWYGIVWDDRVWYGIRVCQFFRKKAFLG